MEKFLVGDQNYYNFACDSLGITCIMCTIEIWRWSVRVVFEYDNHHIVDLKKGSIVPTRHERGVC